MKPRKVVSGKKVATEDRVRNAVVGHIASKGYANNLKIKSSDEHGVDIYATHKDNAARRIFIEAKGNSPGVNKTLAILIAWGQLLSRVTAVNLNRIHGLAFPKEWENNVAKLSSHIVAIHLNVHFFFVDTHGDVEEFTAIQFQRKHKHQ
jgi:hypothetical protein